MSIGIGQLLIILLLGILLFGNAPRLIKDLKLGITEVRKALSTQEKGATTTSNEREVSKDDSTKGGR